MTSARMESTTMRLRTLTLAALLSAAMQTPAGAEPIAIESYAGARPDDARGVVDPLLGDLAKRGYLTGRALVARIEQDVSRSGDPLGRAEGDNLAARAEDGFNAFRQGHFQEAVAGLEQVWAAVLAHPATVAERQDLRDSVIKVLLGLALANSRLDNQEASIKYMAEFLRCFPDREISRAQYGPEPADLARKVRGELERAAYGTLRVEVLDDPGGAAVVFLNERYVSVGSAELDKLYPGVYRVIVRGKLNGRVHEVNVEAGSKKLLQVRLATEAALTTPGSAVLVFPNEDERATGEAASAASLGSALRANEVAVVGIRDVNGRRTLIGALIAADSGRPIRSGSLSMEPVAPSSKQIAALGRFVASGEADPTVIVGGDAVVGGKRGADDDRQRVPWFKDTWGWVLTGTGVAVAGVGIGLLVNASGLDDDADAEADEGKRNDLRERADSRRTLGSIVAPVGAALAVVGIVKLAWPNSRPASRRDSTRVAIGVNWVGLEGSF